MCTPGYICILKSALYILEVDSSLPCLLPRRVADECCTWAEQLTNPVYCTSQKQCCARCSPSPDLPSWWVCVFMYASVYTSRERLQRCQLRFNIFSLLSAPTHFSLCTAAQICKCSLLRMHSTRSASIYSILFSPSLQCLHAAFAFLFGLCCCG